MRTLKTNTMKTLMTNSFAAIIFVLASASVKAETKSTRLATADNSVNLYIETITKGNVENMDALFGSQFIQNTNANGKVTTHSKEQILSFIKGQKNVKQNCNASYALMEQSDDYAVAKVEMKYREFTKIDYVTLSKEGADWKINQVGTTYK